MAKLHTHSTTGDVEEPRRRKRKGREDREARAKSRNRADRRANGETMTVEATDEAGDEGGVLEDRFARVPEPSWSARNRKRRGRGRRGNANRRDKAEL